MQVVHQFEGGPLDGDVQITDRRVDCSGYVLVGSRVHGGRILKLYRFKQGRRGKRAGVFESLAVGVELGDLAVNPLLVRPMM